MLFWDHTHRVALKIGERREREGARYPPQLNLLFEIGRDYLRMFRSRNKVARNPGGLGTSVTYVCAMAKSAS